MKPFLSIFSLVFVLLFLAACEKDEISPKPNETFVLKIGQSAEIQSTGLVIVLDSVKDDSRCPSDPKINCFWEGEVTAVISVSENSTSLGRFALRLLGDGSGVQENNEVVVSDYQIRLVSVDPYPTDTDAIPMKKYEASFRVSLR
jgi:hypothetical protein